MSNVSSGGGGGIVHTNPGTIAAAENQQAINDLEADAFSGAPIVMPLSPKAKMLRKADTFQLPGDPPLPPNESPSNAGVTNFRSGVNFMSSSANGVSIFGGDGSADPSANVFAFMIVLQKILNKEARAELKENRSDQKLQLAQQDHELDLEKTKIGDMQKEAADRYSHAMEAADMEMVLGIASGLATMASACGGVKALGAIGQTIGTIGKFADGIVKVVQGSLTTTIAADKNFADLQKSQGMQSDKDELMIDDAKKQINKLTLDVQNSKDRSDQARDRRKSGLDNIQKILDLLHGMTVNI